GMIMREKDGTPIRMLGAHTDITAVKKKEKILERCNTAANIGYWEINIEKNQVTFSNMMKQILGLPASNAPHRKGPIAYFHNEKERSKVEDAFATARELKSEQQREALIMTESGTEKWVEILIIPEFRADTYTKVFGTLQDIDERVRASMKIDELLKKTEKQNDRLMNFAHTISHNLRSQVGGVSSLVELMEMENSSIVEDELFKYLKLASKKLSETVVHLSEIAVGDEFNEEDYVPLNLRSLIESCVDSIVTFEELNSIEIQNQVPNDFIIYGIEGYVESILHNLITNAIKYRDAEKSPFVKISAGKKGNQNIWFAIEDNGLGIDLNKHGRKLFGLHTTFHEHEDSSGVGLFVTKNQVLAMDGDVEVESEPGVGSTFKVILPQRETKAAAKS
ncbi:MAG TPA: hypothetical protein DEG32_04495, partial [Balneolaceae bacterium]|nr:hypothetical protein [Balneolaceae bacterium]